MVVSEGVDVSVERSNFDLNMTDCDIRGSMVLNPKDGDSLTILNPTNMIVHSNGTLIDGTPSKTIKIPIGNLITVYPGGSFSGTNTKFSVTNGSESTVISSTSGPFTIGVLNDGKIEKRDLVTFMLKKSGDIGNESIFIGNKAIKSSVCSSVGGCGLSIATNLSLTTESLGGLLNIKVNRIDVASGCTFRMGSTRSSSGFRFQYRVEINVAGILSDETDGSGGIQLTAGSIIRILSGASLTIVSNSSIKATDENTGNIIGKPFPILKSIKGPFFLWILENGDIITNSTGTS